MKGKRITLIVTGSISAYKSAELVRSLVKEQAVVHVVMTASASQFITPLTLQTLSRQRVTTSLFDQREELEIGHIRLADETDLVLVAPASANFIAKARAGIADDAASCVLLATKAPVVFAPAMNVNMWENPITQKNVLALHELNYHFIEPESGELACGWFGEGRLADIDTIVERVRVVFTEQDMTDIEVLVTGGPTQEMLDPVRHLSNASSGKMAHALAKVCLRRGAKVTLISGPSNLTPPPGVRSVGISTVAELESAVAANLSADQRSIVFMAAAVSDVKPERVSPTKLKFHKNEPTTLRLIPNRDVLKGLAETYRHKKNNLTLVGFAAETGSIEETIAEGQRKRKEKGVDFIVANRVHETLGKDCARVWIINQREEVTELAEADKTEIAFQIISGVLQNG